ncbi:hypothetical protein ARMSODRAFT_328895 [Armillaria solidipes]|uniref:Uncharacterized protein n=1 Tax=Armillaria solidipes TaxID=1076256 RepID=A0A2H3BUX8_9AGAR|nr:hypothetical protein ARMSODRAFT_328895 [Armillaria solidipes]
MADDFADILGSDSLPVRREFSPSAWSAMSLLKYTGWALGAVVTYVVLVLGWNSFSRARERSYRLSMRRRHGIPDNDHRPFNVAYAAVQRSRQEKERPAPAQRSQENVNTQTAHEARPAQAEQVVRNRGALLNPRLLHPPSFRGSTPRRLRNSCIHLCLQVRLYRQHHHHHLHPHLQTESSSLMATIPVLFTLASLPLPRDLFAKQMVSSNLLMLVESVDWRKSRSLLIIPRSPGSKGTSLLTETKRPGGRIPLLD